VTSPVAEPVAERILDNLVTILKTITTANVAEPYYFHTVTHVDRIRHPGESDSIVLWVEDMGDAVEENGLENALNMSSARLQFSVHFQLSERHANDQSGDGRKAVRRLVHDIQKALQYSNTARTHGGIAVDTVVKGTSLVLSEATVPKLAGSVNGEVWYRYISSDPTTST
jgi:hypothetical protein